MDETMHTSNSQVFAFSSFYLGRPRCPVAWPATTPLLAVEFEIKSEDTAIMVQGNMIALSTARSDLYLRVGGIVRDRLAVHVLFTYTE